MDVFTIVTIVTYVRSREPVSFGHLVQSLEPLHIESQSDVGKSLSSLIVFLPLLHESAMYTENADSDPVGGFLMSIITYSIA